MGDYFLDSIQADIRSLGIFARVHAKADDFHRLLTKRFPFAVYYLLRDEWIDVYAILDCRRAPDWIVKRLDSSGTSLDEDS